MVLRFRSIDKDIFNALKNGKKKVETRAATKKYANVRPGEILKFICGRESFEKKVSKVLVFRNIGALLRKYKPKEINPEIKTKRALEYMYYGFSGYREKIKKHGIIAFELR